MDALAVPRLTSGPQAFLQLVGSTTRAGVALGDEHASERVIVLAAGVVVVGRGGKYYQGVWLGDAQFVRVVQLFDGTALRRMRRSCFATTSFKAALSMARSAYIVLSSAFSASSLLNCRRCEGSIFAYLLRQV